MIDSNIRRTQYGVTYIRGLRIFWENKHTVALLSFFPSTVTWRKLDIIPHARQSPAQSAWPISRLLMTQWRKEAMHQQPWWFSRNTLGSAPVWLNPCSVDTCSKPGDATDIVIHTFHARKSCRSDWLMPNHSESHLWYNCSDARTYQKYINVALN